MAGLIWPYSENEFNVRKSFSFNPQQGEINLNLLPTYVGINQMHCNNMNSLLKLWNTWPGGRGSVPLGRVSMTISWKDIEFYNNFFCTYTLVWDKLNALLLCTSCTVVWFLNCEVHCPFGRG